MNKAGTESPSMTATELMFPIEAKRYRESLITKANQEQLGIIKDRLDGYKIGSDEEWNDGFESAIRWAKEQIDGIKKLNKGEICNHDSYIDGDGFCGDCGMSGIEIWGEYEGN